MYIRNENGFVTIYVFIIMFFIIILIGGKYISENTKLDSKIESFNKTKKEYDDVKEYSSIELDNIDEFDVYRDDIPIYNKEHFEFFSKYVDMDNSPEYFIYQEKAFFIGGANKNYILMSDISIDSELEDLLDDNSLASGLIKILDFNNHIIYTSDGKYIFESNGAKKYSN